MHNAHVCVWTTAQSCCMTLNNQKLNPQPPDWKSDILPITLPHHTLLLCTLHIQIDMTHLSNVLSFQEQQRPHTICLHLALSCAALCIILKMYLKSDIHIPDTFSRYPCHPFPPRPYGVHCGAYLVTVSSVASLRFVSLGAVTLYLIFFAIKVTTFFSIVTTPLLLSTFQVIICPVLFFCKFMRKKIHFH